RPFIWAVETDDSDGNGMIDTINISTSEDLNDDFGDITATVGAYTVSSIDTGLAGNDADFRINLTETGTCDITDITGCDTGATPAVSITANSLLQDNSGWPILISALGDAADFASPIFITRATADGNHDGEIDGYFLLCSEALNNTVDDVTVSIGGGYTVKTTDCSNGWCDWGPVGSAELYSLSLNPSGVWDTDQVPTMDITNGGPIFLADNSPAANLLASDGGPVTPLDGAVPIITEAKYQDASGDGKIDQFELFFSETINAAASRLANELVLGPGSSFAAAAFGSDATDLLTADVDHLVVPLGTAASNISTWDGSGSLNISLIGTGGGAINEFALADRAVPYLSFLDQTIENGSIEAPTIPSDSWFQDYIWPITDGAAPVLLPGYIDYMSTSGNGTVDKIYLLFSETMTCSGLPAIPCTLGQFAINNQSLTGLDDDGTPTSVGVNGVSGEVDLVTTGTTNLTGVTVGGVTGTEPDVIYTAGASYLQDTAGNAVVNFGPTTINDLTSPYLVSFASTTPNSTYGPTAAINVTGAYTEDIQAGGTMDVTLDNGVGITLTAPGAINAVAGTYNVGATASGEDSADLTLASIDVGTENVLDVGGQVRNNSIIPAGNNLGNNNNIVIDTTAPTANFTAATDNVGSVTGALTSGDKTDDPLLALSGTNEAGSSVDVYNGAGLLGAAAVVGGNWSYSAIIADAITYLFNVIETDTVTNISTPTANFTVIGDMTPPTVTTYSPADGAINVAIAANLVLTFNDNVQAGAGAVLIKRGSDNFIVETITIPDVRVTYSGTQVTINPTATLINSTAYYVQIANGAIKDSAGNDYAGIADTTTWNFSTVAAGGGGGGGGGGSSTPSAVSASNVPLTVLPSQSGTLTQGFTDGSQVIVSIPQNSVTNTTTFTVTQGSLTANNTPLATTGAIMIGNQIFNISATSNGTAVTSFNSNLTITITVPSLPDVTTDLGVYYFDSATNQWVLIPGAVFDTVTNKVTFTTNHLTQFAVFKVAGLPSMLPATSTPVATPTPTPTPTPIPAPTPSAPATVGSQLVYDPSNVTSLLASLSLARNTADESKYRPLITADAKEFGITLSSAQLDAIVNFVVYGISNATIKLGSGERRAVIRDYFETVVRPDIVWTDIELISSGQKPVKRNLAKEQSIVNRVLATYKTIVGRGPNFKDAKEDLAWNTMMYRIRFARDLAKEKVGIRKFEEKYGRTPWSALGWSAVRAWGYSLQFKQF
ncbi:MAG: Ig-like domain-containing protein, partial [Candidatus Parcubacteria bacterium]|nr:Ig-like domain-containing protein [Candidatus Parcubacteria bacterium]